MSETATPTEIDDRGGAHSSRRRSRAIVGGFILFAVVIGAYFALGMPGMDHSPATVTNQEMGHGGAEMGWNRQGVTEFADTVARRGVVTINVHIPDEGSIAGTDLTIPYTDVLDDAGLPTDRDTPLAIYCRSDRMSTIAARELLDAGYTDVTELDGGMNAWEGAGRSLGT